MKRKTHGPMKSLKSMSKLSGTDKAKHTIAMSNKSGSRPPSGKNQILVLESIANKWTAMGLYKSPTRAMTALLGGDQ
jgi:hypothetical protein